MTEFHHNGYSIKLVRREAATSASLREELAQTLVRIEDEGIPAVVIDGSDGPELKVPTKVAAERIVDNHRINREGKGELYLSPGSVESNCPSRFPGI
jgi:hypothetical protein